MSYGEITPVVIRDVQHGLSQLGFSVGAIDGIEGPQLTAAICSFQRRSCMKKGKLMKGQQWGAVTSGLHSMVIDAIAHHDYVAPVPPTDLEMEDARRGLLRAQRLLNSWEES